LMFCCVGSSASMSSWRSEISLAIIPLSFSLNHITQFDVVLIIASSYVLLFISAMVAKTCSNDTLFGWRACCSILFLILKHGNILGDSKQEKWKHC
jgi:hypothetical protein